ncbi:hypothetical protein GCM10020295_63720 [Streptomyces cinereospinus]
MVLHPLQRQSARGYRGAQRDVEGAAAQCRVEPGAQLGARIGVRS